MSVYKDKFVEFGVNAVSFLHEDEVDTVVIYDKDSPDMYLLIQTVDGEDDDIYFEFKDQINSCYDCVEKISITKDYLHVIFTKSFTESLKTNMLILNLELTSELFLDLKESLLTKLADLVDHK